MNMNQLLSRLTPCAAALLLAACPGPAATTNDGGAAGDGGSGGCRDECAAGERMMCEGGERSCGNWDEDECLEWSDCVAQCTDRCGSAGEKRCQGNGVQSCGDLDGDGCLEWSELSACGTGETCQNGECSCADGCTQSGQTRCVGEKYQECGDFDADRCLEWSAERACSTGETCSGDRCSADCSNDCATTGQKRCSGNGFQTCGHYDADPCLDWSGVTTCADHQQCQSGACVASCADECQRAGELRCEANGFQTCGNHDADPCLEWDAVTDCKPGETCSNGVCAETCTDECSAGERECTTGYPFAAYRECGEANDGDSCLDWSSGLCIPFIDMCQAGQCVSNCSDECNFEGERQCAGDGYQICREDADSDVCLEWGPITSCAPDACSLGSCVSQCSDECPTEGGRVCEGEGGYRTCGRYDDDVCLDLSGVTACGTGERCEGGACVDACDDTCVWGDFGCTDNDRAEWWCFDDDGDGCVERVEFPCASDETCVDGFCESNTPTCQDDAYEPNDSKTDAAYIIEGGTAGLQICAGDEDWYYLYLLGGETLEVSLAFTHADGDLDLKLLDDAGVVVARSTTVTDGEAASAAATTSGYYFIQVYGYNQAQNDYTMTVTVSSAAGCADDGYEPNNTAGAASFVSQGSFPGLQLCAGDEDWYEVFLGAGDSLDASIAFTHADGDIDLRVQDATGAEIDQSLSTSDNEAVTVPTVSTYGSYFLRVYGANSGVESSYALTVDITYTSICFDDHFEENDTRATAAKLDTLAWGVNPYYDLQLCAGDEDWYEVYMYAEENLTVDLAFSHSAGDLDVYLFDASGGQLTLANSSSDNEHLERAITAAGYYYLQVKGYQDAENGYDMTITVN